LSNRVQLTESDFLQHFLQNAPHTMWFLGAGTSRTAGLPTATDIVWDLKRRYYCLHENQDLQSHDINSNTIKRKIQDYMDSQGFPALWSSEEYSFYFDLTFGDDYDAQQKYIQEALSSEKVSLNIGHRALAALLEMEQARIVFTTNFDDVLETAYADVSGKNIIPFHLEGSYAALTALNAERFPIYAKIHGDFRYKSIKNLEADLLGNDCEIQKCFLATAVRYGLIVCGYSGRDENVITMFREAIDQNNAFPHGLFWTVPNIKGVADIVTELIDFARQKGVRAHLVETGTFDEMLSKMWRQVEGKPPELDARVRTASIDRVSIPLPEPGKKYPILRTNALPVIKAPTSCGIVELTNPMTFRDLKEKIIEERPNVVLTYTDKVLFWGKENEIVKILPKDDIKRVQRNDFDDASQSVSDSTFVKSFFEEGLAKALIQDKPLILRRARNRTYFIVVRSDKVNEEIFSPLRSVLDFKGKPGYITGNVPGLQNVTWTEAVSVSLEERGGMLWVMMRPDIWIKPLEKRQEAREFLRKRRLYRYNNKSYNLLDAWIGILLSSVGKGESVEVTCFPDAQYKAVFEIGSRTAYSSGGFHGK
jgi:SIR2-like protein